MCSNFSICRTAWLCPLLFFMWLGSVTSAPRKIIVHVNVPPLAWSSSTFEAKLIRHLSRRMNGDIMAAQQVLSSGPEFPTDLYHLDSLVNWGREVGGRYLLIVDIGSERLEKRKSFHLPLIFHRYQTVGVIQAEVRLIDISREKSLIVKTLTVEQKGPQIFQATMDDDINDPDIHIAAPDKLRFFDRLEEELALRVTKRVRKVIR